MPLIMGDWKLFIDKKNLLLKFSNLNSRGYFFCSLADLIHGGVPPLHGEGFWNEVAQQISFFMYTNVPDSPDNKIHYFFNGYQIEGLPTLDPSSDKLWTLLGTYQVSLLGESFEKTSELDILVQNPRRQKLGWYAQITEVL